MSGSVDTVLLRTFLEVHRTRHFGRAAEQLYLTQSAVSFRIRQLEELLGVKLFERYRNNIRLTPSGERLLPHAEAMLTTWQRALQEVSQTSSPRRPLAIGASASLWDALLYQPVVEFSARSTDVALSTETANGHSLIRGLLEHTLDLAVLIDPPKVEELHVQSLGAVELALVSSQPINTNAQLAQLDYVLINWGTAFSIQQTRALPISLTPVLQTSQTRIALAYLLSKPAVAFLPDSVSDHHIRSGKLYLVPEVERVQRSLHLVHRKGHQNQELIEQLVLHLRQNLSTVDG